MTKKLPALALFADVPATASGETVPGRHKLWEVHDRYMCSLVGTCLGVKEIRKLALHDRLCGPDIGDYDLHGLIVATCRTRSRTSRALHKILERRYKAAVRRFSKAQTQEELLQLWAEGMEKGAISGPFWALVTHPHATMTALEVAFGDVHMASHALGATRRINQQDYDNLTESLEHERGRTAQLRRVLKKRDEALEAAEALAAKQEARIQTLNTRLEDDRGRVELQQEVGALHAEADNLRAALKEERRRREEALRHNRRVAQKNRRHGEDLHTAHIERDAALEETDAVEAHLMYVLASPGDRLEPDGTTLRGLRVLYVGGRTNLVPHYRALVELQGGSFVHHDGGLEQNCTGLESLVSGAELVLCPIDAISHNSCLRVKKACKHHTRPFLPLRTASMASLVSAIRRETRLHGPHSAGLDSAAAG